LDIVCDSDTMSGEIICPVIREDSGPKSLETRILKVKTKTKKTVAGGGDGVVSGGGGGGGGGGGDGGGYSSGIDVFDRYLTTSGLESKPYQREGVSFCLDKETIHSVEEVGGAYRVPRILGGIIADEMGLGKTIVMIGLILANLASLKRTLIVVPVALIAQWVAQLKKTVIDSGVKPDLTIAVYHGASRRNIRNVPNETGDGSCWYLVSRSRGQKSSSTKNIDIVITTYGSVAMEVPSSKTKTKTKTKSTRPSIPRLSLLTFRADRVIFDEAHHLRNKKNRVFRGAMHLLGRNPFPAASSLSSSTTRIWIVTGTPIQNKLSDLKSLCYILGFLPTDVMHPEQQAFIRKNYVLRRTKLSVGMISDNSSKCSLGGGVGGGNVGLLKSLEHSCSNVDWGNSNELLLSREIHSRAKYTSNRNERLKLYTRMRQMCVLPALLTYDSAAKGAKGVRQESVIDTYDVPMEVYKSAVSEKSKLNMVVDVIMRQLSEDPTRKSLVFCLFRREMIHLRDLIRSRCFDIDIDIIDGTVSGVRRNRILAASPQILLLQIRTCSEGLNLQPYSNVFFVSPNWNPCVEDQAIARCYRMGQTSQVRVFRFYMTDFVGGGGGGDGDGVGDVGLNNTYAVDNKEQQQQQQQQNRENITTLDNKCEETQARKRLLCSAFLDGNNGREK
jgi:SNF2 family DNA or RNA helicase